MCQEDERKRTTDKVSKIIWVVPKPGFLLGFGTSAEGPAYWLRGTRHKGGMILI